MLNDSQNYEKDGKILRKDVVYSIHIRLQCLLQQDTIKGFPHKTDTHYNLMSTGQLSNTATIHCYKLCSSAIIIISYTYQNLNTYHGLLGTLKIQLGVVLVFSCVWAVRYCDTTLAKLVGFF